MKKWILGNSNTASKDATLWNAIASVLYSFQSALFLLVITRTTGLVDGGIFTIAYTVTQMMTTIGSYGMREFQASDAKREYSFKTYLSSRYVSLFAMILICMSYSVIQGYGPEKIVLIVLLCLYRVVDNVDDIIQGEMQRSLRFDVAAKIMTSRIAVSSIVFMITYIISKNLIIACSLMVAAAALTSFALTVLSKGLFSELRIGFTTEGLLKLLITCFPICISNFIYNYLVNAPKYAIDRNLSDEVQSVFTILFMPIFAINMFSMFIFKPLVASMGIEWTSGNKKNFLRMVLKQSGVILFITIILSIAGAVAGTPVLGLIYGVDLSSYRWLFVLLIVFGGLAAFSTFFVVVLTIMRKQIFIVVSYVLGAIFEIVLVDKVVSNKGILGAGLMYGGGIGIVCLTLIIVIAIFVIKEKKLEDNNCV